MYEGNPGKFGFGSSQREVRVSEGSSYRESTTVHINFVADWKFVLKILFSSSGFGLIKDTMPFLPKLNFSVHCSFSTLSGNARLAVVVNLDTLYVAFIFSVQLVTSVKKKMKLFYFYFQTDKKLKGQIPFTSQLVLASWHLL